MDSVLSSTRSSRPPPQRHYIANDTVTLTTTFLQNGVRGQQNPNRSEHWIIIDYDVGTLVANGATIILRDPPGSLLSLAGTRAQSNIVSDQLAPPTPPDQVISLGDGLIETSQNPVQLNAPVKILVRPGYAVAVSVGTLQVSIIRVACLLDAAEWLR